MSKEKMGKGKEKRDVKREGKTGTREKKRRRKGGWRLQYIEEWDEGRIGQQK